MIYWRDEDNEENDTLLEEIIQIVFFISVIPFCIIYFFILSRFKR